MKKNVNWDEIKEELQNTIKLEKNKDDLSVKIILLESNLEENDMIVNMMKGEEEMRQSLGQFLNEKEPIDCDIEMNKEEKYTVLRFKDKTTWKKVYNLFNDIFFGDFLKTIIEAMMDAFKQFKPDL